MADREESLDWREEQFRFGDAVAADSNQDFRSFTSGTTQLSIIIWNGF